MITIRPYRNEDWPMVKAWWDFSGENPPRPTMMPEESSFIAEIDGTPALAAAIYLTNTKDVAYVENFVGNPECKGKDRQDASLIFVQALCDFAAKLGFRNLIGMAHRAALKSYYPRFGFSPALDGITFFVKEIK